MLANRMAAMNWNPVSRLRFEQILREELTTLNPEELKTYEAHAIGLLEHPCHRGEKYGQEKVFVVARAGKRLLLFDDVEDEFAVGVPGIDAILRHWELHGPLGVALRNIAEDK